MKIRPRRLTKVEIAKILKSWESDIDSHNNKDAESDGTHCVHRLIDHIAYLEAHIELLTNEPKSEVA